MSLPSRHVTITAQHFRGLACGWLLIADVCIGLSQMNGMWIAQILAFLSVIFLPGLVVLALLRCTKHPRLETLVYAFGLGVLFLMLSGLLANLLYAIGVSQPLTLPVLFIVWNSLVLVSVCAAAYRWQPQRMRLYRRWRWSWSTIGLGAAALCVPLIAAGGAFRLNNGGDALVAMIALGWASCVIAYIFAKHRRLTDAANAWCLFAVGLGILLMTALRSWDITGHDFPHEFRVFTLTATQSYWDIAAFRDPYNACLSITILPQVFTQFLNVSGLVVFKFLLQIIFAVTPVVVYILLRRFVSPFGALVGCVLFISYPTFINDSAMLTRQGVAYLFFALACISAFYARPQPVHKVLFLLCVLGVVLSHYSTSYVFVAMVGLALGCKLLLPLVRRRNLQPLKAHSVFTTSMFITVAGMTFVWYSQITATSKGLATTLQHAAQNIPHLLSDDNKSSDTAASLLLAKQESPVEVYHNYLANSAAMRASLPLEYEPELTSDNMPVTALGERLIQLGIDPAITNTLRQIIAKLLQLVASLGVVFAVFRLLRQRPHALPTDVVCISVAGIIVLLSLIILPTLSLNYGILRAFQQALIFLLVPLIIFLVALGSRVPALLKRTTAASVMLGLFLLFTGFFAQLFGGVSAPLTLNNYGLYYGLYYTTAAELQGYTWIKQNLPEASNVHAASFAKAIMHDPYYPFRNIGVLPGQTPVNSYVFLNQSQMVARKLYVYHDGSSLITTFPLTYYRQYKSQIYSTSTTGVFR